MKLLGRLIFHIISNSIALLAADYLVAGFLFQGQPMDLITAGAVLTIINTFLRPLLTLFLGPFIILTFGLLLIVINAATLYLLDILIANLTIQGLVPLLLATLIVGLTNTFVHLTARSAYRK